MTLIMSAGIRHWCVNAWNKIIRWQRREKIVFFDVDGTLLPEGTSSVPESTVRAMRKLKENLKFNNLFKSFTFCNSIKAFNKRWFYNTLRRSGNFQTPPSPFGEMPELLVKNQVIPVFCCSGRFDYIHNICVKQKKEIAWRDMTQMIVS